MALAADPEIKAAAAILRAGGLVAIPTETVYGLAADATNDAAVARIFEMKGRPAFNPLIVHVTDRAAAEEHVVLSPVASRLADAFWPGALTLVLPRRASSTLSLLVSAGLDTVALRSPAHPIARRLIALTERPLAAPSANRSGTPSPTTAEHVRESLGARIDTILDGGPAALGLESTIVRVEGETATLLRPGSIRRAEIEAVFGSPLRQARRGPVEAPGMLESHYAPAAALRLDAVAPQPEEAYLAFGPAPGGHRYTLPLSTAGDLREAAAAFFAQLRAADRLCAERGLAGIAVSPIPMEGLGEAINDRLRRAAAPRPSEQA